jgi:hypothetical protein
MMLRRNEAQAASMPPTTPEFMREARITVMHIAVVHIALAWWPRPLVLPAGITNTGIVPDGAPALPASQ